MAQKLDHRLGKVTRAVGRRVRAARARFRRQRRRGKAHSSQRGADRERKKRERQERARRATITALTRLLTRRVSGLRFRGHVLWLKTRHRWRVLRVRPKAGTRFAVEGGFSPGSDLLEGDVEWVLDEVKDVRVVRTSEMAKRRTSGVEAVGDGCDAVHEGPLTKEIAGGLPGAMDGPWVPCTRVRAGAGARLPVDARGDCGSTCSVEYGSQGQSPPPGGLRRGPALHAGQRT